MRTLACKNAGKKQAIRAFRKIFFGIKNPVAPFDRWGFFCYNHGERSFMRCAVMIRKISERDREAFLSLSEQFYSSPAVLHPVPKAFHEDTFRELMRSEEYAVGFMLESDGECAGFALLAKTFSREAGGLVLWLEELFVLPQFRSHGLGREFFSFLEQYAAEKGCARIRLEVEEENVRAVSLYKRLGYENMDYRQMYKQLRDSLIK